MDYENCEHAPLVQGNEVIDLLSTTPLHISFVGIGLQVLNIIQAEAVKLDTEIKD